MSQEIPVATNPNEFTAQLSAIHEADGANAILARLGGGVLRFANAIFPDAEPDEIYAQAVQREPQGRGAHFDIYNTLLSADYKWLSVYNLAGEASVRTMTLPAELAKTYDQTYPKPTEAAHEARRQLAKFAIEAPDAQVFTGQLLPGMGFVLAQNTEGPHIVHEITPLDPTNAGRFIKMVVPIKGRTGRKVKEALASEGYTPLDNLVTAAVNDAATRLTKPVLPERGVLTDFGQPERGPTLDTALLDSSKVSLRSPKQARRHRATPDGMYD